MSQMNFMKLQSDLINFGLNPTEWSIQQIRSTCYRIRHNVDQDFAFVGTMEFKKSRPRWRNLILVSL